MRPIILATALLFALSGCAAAEPQASEITQTAQPTETQTTQEPVEASADASSEASEPESSEQQTEAESIEVESESSEEPSPQATSQGQATSEPSPSQTQEPAAEPSQEPSEQIEEPAPEPEIVGYTLAEVAQRNSASDCWVAIDGGVYDLTMWISRHPGGAAAITQLCGTDGTQQFLGMHGGQSRPASTLDGYYIGPLR